MYKMRKYYNGGSPYKAYAPPPPRMCSILTLRALDHHVISDEEIIENLHVSSSFKPLTPNLRLQLHQTSPKVGG